MLFFVYFKRPTYLHIQDTLDKKVSILMNNFYFTTGRIFHFSPKKRDRYLHSCLPNSFKVGIVVKRFLIDWKIFMSLIIVLKR